MKLSTRVTMGLEKVHLLILGQLDSGTEHGLASSPISYPTLSRDPSSP